jgi:putative transposase
VEILQAYKFKLLAKGSQARAMARFAGCKRFVYNKAQAVRKSAFEEKRKSVGYGELARLLTAWRADAQSAWLAEAPVHPRQQALKELDSADKNFFEGRGRFPQFKRKGESESVG